MKLGLGISLAKHRDHGRPSNAETLVTQDGITVPITGTRTTGQYVDGSYWVLAPDGNGAEFQQPIVEAGTEAETFEGVTCLYIGRAMIDPGAEGTATQGFDDRLALNGRGPGNIYDADVGEDFPFSAAAYADGSPKTVWLYRGRDIVVNGSENSGCYSISQITLVSADPGPNAIKPTGLYVAGGKPTYTTADIDYDLYTPVAIPAGAAEPNWDADFGYLKRPMTRFGDTVNFAFIAPNRSEETYPAYQMEYTGQLLLGMLSNSSDREELINRVVRCGLDVKALADLASTAFVANGGFGVGGKGLWFFARQFLGEAWTLPPPIEYAGHEHEYFQEDSTVFLGQPAAGWPDGKPLWGAPGQGYPNGPWTANHITRDVNGLREPHWLNHHSGTAEGGSSTTIDFDKVALAAKIAAGWENVQAGYHVYIVSGTGAGQLRLIGSWNNTTKTATMTGAWATAPDNTSVYEYGNGGTYQVLNMPGHTMLATALVIAGEVDAWNKDAFFYLQQRWIDDNGLLTPRSPLLAPNMSDFARRAAKWGDGNGTWSMLFWEDYAEAIWPTQEDPGGTPVTIWSTSLSTGNDVGWGGYSHRMVFPATGTPERYFVLVTDHAASSDTRYRSGLGTIDAPGATSLAYAAATNSYNSSSELGNAFNGQAHSCDEVQIRGSGSGREIRAHMVGPTSGTANFDNVSIGVWNSPGPSYDIASPFKGSTSATPVELLFSGVSGVTGLTNAGLWSDWVSFAESPNLVTDSGFDDPTVNVPWNAGTGWAVTGSKGVFSGGAGFSAISHSATAIVGGASYVFQIDVTEVTSADNNIVFRCTESGGGPLTQHQINTPLSGITAPQTLTIGPVTIDVAATHVNLLVMALASGAAFKVDNARIVKTN